MQRATRMPTEGFRRIRAAPKPKPRAPRARPLDGGGCRITDDCDFGLLCAKSGKCRAPVAVNSICSDDAPCAPTAGCLSGKCIAPIENGAVCDPSVDLCDPYRALACDPFGM